MINRGRGPTGTEACFVAAPTRADQRVSNGGVHMALVRRSAAELLAESKADRLHELLSEQARFQLESRVGVSEVRSWRRSLPVLLGDLADAGLEHVEVLLEHKLPHSPKRVDAVLCGTHPRTGEPSY